MAKNLALWGLKTCDTTRKALKDMEKAGLSVAFEDLRDRPLSPVLRAEALAQLGDRALNRASTTWRSLPEADRALPPDTLLAAHPTLWKRPLIRRGAEWFCGWTPAVQQVILG